MNMLTRSCVVRILLKTMLERYLLTYLLTELSPS
jgi:hypothetical protein